MSVSFIFTHLGSDYEKLTKTLQKHPNIQVYNTGNEYHHPDDLALLTSKPHKKRNAAAVWVDVLFFNQQFTCQALCKFCKFIYWTSEWNKIDLIDPDLYYNFRIQGMKIYHKRTGGLWNPSLAQEDLLFSSISG